MGVGLHETAANYMMSNSLIDTDGKMATGYEDEKEDDSRLGSCSKSLLDSSMMSGEGSVMVIEESVYADDLDETMTTGRSLTLGGSPRSSPRRGLSPASRSESRTERASVVKNKSKIKLTNDLG